MQAEKTIKRIREGRYLAEVEVELQRRPGRDYATLTLNDVHRLEQVREALKRGDLQTAAKDAKLFAIQPLESPGSNAA